MVRSSDIADLLQDSLSDVGFEDFLNSERNCSLFSAMIRMMWLRGFIGSIPKSNP